MTNAFGYLRVSGKGQLDGDGFPRQAAAIQKFCSQQSLKIVRTFEEKGVTGTAEGMDRAAWVEMIQTAMDSKDTHTIVIERLDRLARDLMIQEHIIADVKSRGLTLVSVAEPDLCLDDPSRKLLRQIMGAINEYDKTMIVLKLRGARQKIRASAGKCEGRKAYGAHPKHPEEIQILAEIRELRKNRFSLVEIAAKLNKANKPTRGKGNKWFPNTVARILKRSKTA